jgi:hypothetical protein
LSPAPIPENGDEENKPIIFCEKLENDGKTTAGCGDVPSFIPAVALGCMN